MTNDPAYLKKKLRSEMRAQLAQLDPNEKHALDELIFKQLSNYKKFQQAKTIGIYASTKLEAGTHQIIKQTLGNKQVFLPVINGAELEFHQLNSTDELTEGKFNILEPPKGNKIAPQELDLLIVPAVAIDKYGHRLGQGGGFYDRMLTDEVHSLAIIYNFQLVNSLPKESHDKPVGVVITESKTVEF